MGSRRMSNFKPMYNEYLLVPREIEILSWHQVEIMEIASLRREDKSTYSKNQPERPPPCLRENLEFSAFALGNSPPSILRYFPSIFLNNKGTPFDF